jgi:hypothetical protein
LAPAAYRHRTSATLAIMVRIVEGPGLVFAGA